MNTLESYYHPTYLGKSMYLQLLLKLRKFLFYLSVLLGNGQRQWYLVIKQYGTVHSIVQYACPVWNPHQQYVSEKKKLGKIQRKKMLTSSLPNVCLSISSGFKTCSIYMWSQGFSLVKWELLDYAFDRFQLSHFFAKSKHSHFYIIRLHVKEIN